MSAELLLAELESTQLQVVLVPSRRPNAETDCIRVAVEKNPDWYRSFCARHPSSRGTRRGKFDTKIRRANVAAVLKRLAAGLPSKSKYATELGVIAERLSKAAA